MCHYQNDKQLIFCTEMMFISRAIPILANGSANYESPCVTRNEKNTKPRWWLPCVTYHWTRNGLFLQWWGLHRSKTDQNWCSLSFLAACWSFCASLLLLFFSEYRVHIADSVSDGDLTNKSLAGDTDRSQHSLLMVSALFSLIYILNGSNVMCSDTWHYHPICLHDFLPPE